tara:strand:- start:1791 stop:2837 length:1047 start_codon:yes stop_codon:yes gene_type:complete
MELDNKQKTFIDQNYLRIPDIDLLTRTLFEDDSLDGRNKEGKAVANYMIEKGYGYKTRVHKKAKKIVLTRGQKDLIDEYAQDDLSSLQIAQMVFQDVEVRNLGIEQRAVAEYLKTNGPDFIKAPALAEKRKYIPPKSPLKVISKINEFTQAGVNEDKLKREEKEYVEKLRNYLNSPRFMQLMNTYNCDDAELFEAEFVRATWDKPDLTIDEVNLYINVCVDYINLKTINRNMEKLNRMFDEVEEQQEMSIKLAEILKAKSAEYHQCEQRQESLIKKLNGDRAVRTKNKQEKFGSVLSLVQAFQNEEERIRMIDLAEKQKLLVKSETDNLESMDSWKARIMGLRKGDVL